MPIPTRDTRTRSFIAVAVRLFNLGSFGGDYSVSSPGREQPGDGRRLLRHGRRGYCEHAFLHASGGMKDLGTLGGAVSEALDINESGQIVGYSQVADGSYHGFLFAGNTPMIDLGPYQAMLINNAGLVVATSGSWPQNNTYLSSGGTGTWTNIGSLGGGETEPYGMNNWGNVVGTSSTSSSTELTQAFLYSSGKMTDLGTFGGQSSTAWGINDSGVVSAPQTFPAIWRVTVGLLRQRHNRGLEQPCKPSVGWTIDRAMAINDRGQIAAWAYQQNDKVHAVLLTPTPEPSSICILTVAAVAFVAIKARRFSNGLEVSPANGVAAHLMDFAIHKRF